MILLSVTSLLVVVLSYASESTSKGKMLLVQSRVLMVYRYLYLLQKLWKYFYMSSFLFLSFFFFPPLRLTIRKEVPVLTRLFLTCRISQPIWVLIPYFLACKGWSLRSKIKLGRNSALWKLYSKSYLNKRRTSICPKQCDFHVATKFYLWKTGLLPWESKEMWKPEHLVLWALGSTSPVALLLVPGGQLYLSFLLQFCPAALRFVNVWILPETFAFKQRNWILQLDWNVINDVVLANIKYFTDGSGFEEPT